MKKIMLTLLMSGLLLCTGISRTMADSQTEVQEPQTNIEIGENGLKIRNEGEVLNISLGKKAIVLTENNGRWPSMKIEKSIIQDEDKNDRRRRYRSRFTPHWSGVEFGLSNYMTADFATSLPAEINYMDLNTGKSYSFNLNFAQLGLGLTRHIGLVTGVGLEFNSYSFDGNNNIVKNDMGMIEPYYADDDGITLEKSKFSTTYFVVPVMLEIQVPVNHHNTINIAGGIMGGAKLGSKTKMVYYDGGKEKIKEKDDYSLNSFRYGPTLRLGYESFQLYGTYYMNGLFEEGKGPELYPFQIGIAFTFD